MSTPRPSRRRPVLVTVSGIVGSGKTTTVRHISSLLRSEGLEAHGLNFQSLPCFTYLRSREPTRTRIDENDAESALRSPAGRWQGYRRKRLTISAAVVYLVRVAAFRLYRVRWRAGEWYLLNRYFYDLFVHYRLASRTERLLFAVLRQLIPRPDVAFLVEAGTGTIAVRRPAYSREYVLEVGQAYRALGELFPELIVVPTDRDAHADRAGHIIAAALGLAIRE